MKPVFSAVLLTILFAATPLVAQEKSFVGLIPKAQKPVVMDGKLDEWQGAFITPVHIGHPDFADRGGQFLYLWDAKNLYIGLQCLDRHPAHIAPDTQIYSGDAVEFYLDVRSGKKLGAKEFGPGTLHMFWTPFTGTAIKPRMQVRSLPAFKNFKLKGAAVAARKTAWGWQAEFKLPWKHFPDFMPKAGRIIGIDCELCSSDGKARVDRMFVYSSPRSVSTPAAFGRVKLVERCQPDDLKSCSRALLPLSVTRAGNYPWLYAKVGISATVADQVAKIEGRIVDAKGNVKKKTGGKRYLVNGINIQWWRGRWELFDLTPGNYTLEIRALDKTGREIGSRKVKLVRGK